DPSKPESGDENFEGSVNIYRAGYMIILKDILYKSGILNVSGPVNIGITDVCFDSRLVKEGSLFVAIRGLQSDGHSFIPFAIEKGAVAIVCETLPLDLSSDITYVQ